MKFLKLHHLATSNLLGPLNSILCPQFSLRCLFEDLAAIVQDSRKDNDLILRHLIVVGSLVKTGTTISTERYMHLHPAFVLDVKGLDRRLVCEFEIRFWKEVCCGVWSAGEFPACQAMTYCLWTC